MTAWQPIETGAAMTCPKNCTCRGNLRCIEVNPPSPNWWSRNWTLVAYLAGIPALFAFMTFLSEIR